MRVVIFLFLSLLSGKSFSQYSYFPFQLYNYDYSLVNPAYTDNYIHKATIIGKTYGFPYSFENDNSLQFLFSYDLFLKNQNIGAGAMLYRDKFGSQTNLYFSIPIKYRFVINKDFKVSAAVRSGIHRQTIDFSQYTAVTPEDPILNLGNETQYRPYSDLAVHFNFKNIHGGISLIDAISGKFDFGLGNLVAKKNPAYYSILLGTGFKLNSSLKSEHSVLAIKKNRFLLDLNNTLIIKDLIVFGISVQSESRFSNPNNADRFHLRFNGGISLRNRLKLICTFYETRVQRGGFRGELMLQGRL